MTVLFPEFPEKNISGSLGSRYEDSYCADLGFWHWKFRHYLHHFQFFKDIKGLCGDKQANYVNFFAIAIISLNSLACLFWVTLTSIRDYYSLCPYPLSHLSTLCIRTIFPTFDTDGHICRFDQFLHTVWIST